MLRTWPSTPNALLLLGQRGARLASKRNGHELLASRWRAVRARRWPLVRPRLRSGRRAVAASTFDKRVDRMGRSEQGASTLSSS